MNHSCLVLSLIGCLWAPLILLKAEWYFKSDTVQKIHLVSHFDFHCAKEPIIGMGITVGANIAVAKSDPKKLFSLEADDYVKVDASCD